jgi:hypothetical protein
LRDKSDYLVHGALLQLYLDLGVKIKEIKKVISFRQSTWLKKYIDFNSNKRQEARRNKNAFESNFFKLLNNAVYGKFVENMKNRMSFDIRSNTQKIRKQINSLKVTAFHIFNEYMIGVETRKKEVVLNRPISIGFAILDYSKFCMYNFYYNKMKPIYGDRVEVLYTDTDSLIMNTYTEDIFADMKAHSELYDFSEYPVDHPIFQGMKPDEIQEMKMKNQAVVGKVKDELKGATPKSFVAVKAKMYSLLFDYNGREIQKSAAKGVARQAKAKRDHDQYKRLLFGDTKDKIQSATSMRIDCMWHTMTTKACTKISLSATDDKRFYVDHINSHAIGFNGVQ